MLTVCRPGRGWCSHLLEQVGHQQGAPWPGRQRGERTVWLPNEPLKEIDPAVVPKGPGVLVTQFSLVCNWSMVRVGAGTLTSACPLAAAG